MQIKNKKFWLTPIVCLLTAQAAVGLVFAQNTVLLAPGQSKRTAADILPDKLANATAASIVKPQKESDLASADKRTAGLAMEYGLVSAASRIYKSGKLRTTVTIFQLDTPSHAYGLFSGWGDGLQLIGDYPPQGKTIPSGLFFWQSRYLVQIVDDAATTTVESFDSRKQIASAVSERIGGVVTDVPGVISHLPQNGLIANSERYIVGATAFTRFVHYPDPSQIDFTGGTEVATGEYNINGEQGQLVIVEFQTPQLATVGLERMQKSLDSLPPDQRNKVLLKREGNYAVETIGFTNRTVAESLAGNVKYTYTVKWITKPPRAPIDMSSYQKDALRLLIGIFLAIGLAAVIAVGGGVFFGRLLFMRRRAQLQNVFSDAGGMVRLNLDEMVPHSLAESKQKALSDGD